MMWLNNTVTLIPLFLWLAGVTAASEYDIQQTLIAESQSIDATPARDGQDVYDYGVGLDLTGSYGAISISYSNGTKTNLARIEGSDSYKALFKKYSLEASQHLHPPYQNWDESETDWPRQRQRQLNKARGLPASQDVGVISDMISSLITTAQSCLGHNITAALAAAPNLVALYQEDVADAFEYSALQSLDSSSDLAHLYRQTIAAVAGNGLGLCHDFKDIKLCQEEEMKMGIEIVLSVMYTTDCLCVELVDIISASYGSSHRASPPTMDFTLGLRALHDNPSEEYYWEAVRSTMLRGMLVDMHDHEPKRVFVLGDQSHNVKFRAILEEVLLQYLGKLPQIFDEDPVFRAAQGAAEMARRRRYVW